MVDVLRLGLEQAGHTVSVAYNGSEGLELASHREFGVIVLDVMLPGLDGFQVATSLRRDGNHTPILMLTARDFEADVVRGLDCGAEDYVTKPFSFLELCARIRALLRRGLPLTSRFEIDDVVLDDASHRVTRDGVDIRLSPIQYRLLHALLRAQGQVVRRRELIDEAWGASAWVEDNTLDVAVGSLRALIDRGRKRRLIATVRGFGYRIDQP